MSGAFASPYEHTMPRTEADRLIILSSLGTEIDRAIANNQARAEWLSEDTQYLRFWVNETVPDGEPSYVPLDVVARVQQDSATGELVPTTVALGYHRGWPRWVVFNPSDGDAPPTLYKADVENGRIVPSNDPEDDSFMSAWPWNLQNTLPRAPRRLVTKWLGSLGFSRLNPPTFAA